MPVNVYYLDDEEALCDLFSELVGSEQIAIKTFTDPGEAISACNSNPPDIFFIDYRLPGTTGDLVALDIEESIPKVLVTGDLSCKSSYQFNKVISKPCDYEEVSNIISEFL